MSDARDELVDVIAEALTDFYELTQVSLTHPNDWHTESAKRVLAVLVERFGEPEIETFVQQEVINNNWTNTPKRRLAFPWQAVGEGA